MLSANLWWAVPNCSWCEMLKKLYYVTDKISIFVEPNISHNYPDKQILSRSFVCLGEPIKIPVLCRERDVEWSKGDKVLPCGEALFSPTWRDNKCYLFIPWTVTQVSSSHKQHSGNLSNQDHKYQNSITILENFMKSYPVSDHAAPSGEPDGTPWTETGTDCLSSCDLLISCTPTWIFPNPDDSPYNTRRWLNAVSILAQHGSCCTSSEGTLGHFPYWKGSKVLSSWDLHGLSPLSQLKQLSEQSAWNTQYRFCGGEL